MKIRTKNEKKVVIRHLPPTLSSEQFIEQVSPISDHNYYYYVKGDPSLGAFSYSRAYINFINQEDILHFREKFDNYVFVDDKGNEYPAIVELALYQGVPKRRKKVDVRCKTIETDPNFLQFVENKENQLEVSLPTVQECLEEIEAKEKESKSNHMITPLLDYINNASKRQMDVKKRSSKDERRDKKDERRKRERKNKGKEWPSNESSSSNANLKTGNKENSSKDGDNKESIGKESIGQEPRKRYRRRREERKLKIMNEKSGESNKTEKREERRNDKKDVSASAKRMNAVSSSKSEEVPRTTFTVKILTNEKRNSDVTNEAKSNEPKEKKTVSGERIRNKNRPSIQIYKPSARLSTNSKDQKDASKPNQERPSRRA